MSCHGGTVVAHPPLALELSGGCDAGVGAQAQAGAAVGLQAPPLPGEHSSRLEQAAPSLVSPVLIYSAIPPFLPGPPPSCTSPSYESEKGRLTLGGRQPAAGSTGQVPPRGGVLQQTPCTNTCGSRACGPKQLPKTRPSCPGNLTFWLRTTLNSPAARSEEPEVGNTQPSWMVEAVVGEKNRICFLLFLLPISSPSPPRRP